MPHYDNYWFESRDGLKLFARNYQHEAPRATILCIPGLTRNSADFSELCEHLAINYRVIAVELRGRGKSEYDTNPLNYHPELYVDDVVALLDSLELTSVILIGTSLGGLISMILTALQPERVAAVIMNDIGPETSQVGVDRIKNYVCNPVRVNSWAQAIDMTQEVFGAEYPDFVDEDWAAFTKNIYRENSKGGPVLNYDPAIGLLMTQQQDNAVAPNLWSAFAAMQTTPLLVIRGRLSDILTTECVEKMQLKKPDMHFIELEDRGHAPLLTETECKVGIDNFLVSL